MKSSTLPVRSDVKQVTGYRGPTKAEIKFGHGATHYLDFPVKDCIRKDGSLKTRIKASDGLIYSFR